jgi:hypothetical protein
MNKTNDIWTAIKETKLQRIKLVEGLKNRYQQDRFIGMSQTEIIETLQALFILWEERPVSVNYVHRLLGMASDITLLEFIGKPCPSRFLKIVEKRLFQSPEKKTNL